MQTRTVEVKRKYHYDFKSSVLNKKAEHVGKSNVFYRTLIVKLLIRLWIILETVF